MSQVRSIIRLFCEAPLAYDKSRQKSEGSCSAIEAHYCDIPNPTLDSSIDSFLEKNQFACQTSIWLMNR